MKFLVALVCLAAVVAAEPEADASVLYGGYGYGYPSVYGYGAYGYGYPAYGYGAYGYGGHYLGKRDAEASVLGYATPYVYAPVVYRPAGASYQTVADQFHVSAHSTLHKRSAEPQAVGVHPFGVSSTYRSVQGAPALSLPYAYAYAPYHAIGKRSAEPQAVGVHPFGLTSSTFRSVQGASALSLTPYAYAYAPYHAIGKRSAEPSVLGYATPYVYAPVVYRPAGASYQTVADQFHVSAHSTLHKRSAEPQAVGVHPYGLTSSTFRSVQGASALSLTPYAYNTYPYAYYY